MKKSLLSFVLTAIAILSLSSCSSKTDIAQPLEPVSKLTKSASSFDQLPIGEQHNVLLSAYLTYFESTTCPIDSIAHTMCSIAEPYFDKECTASQWAEIVVCATSQNLMNNARSSLDSNYVCICIEQCFESIENSDKVDIADIPMIVMNFIDELEISNSGHSIYKENSVESAMLSTLKYSTEYWCNSSNRSRWHTVSTHMNLDDEIVLDMSNKRKILSVVKADVYGAGAGFLFSPIASAAIGSVFSAYAVLRQD